MYVRGRASTTRRPARRPSPATARARAPLPGGRRKPARAASSSRTIAPTLCRFPAYAGPGFPARRSGKGPSEDAGGGRVRPSRGRRALPAPPLVVLSLSGYLSSGLSVGAGHTSAGADSSPPSAVPSAFASSDSSRSMPASASSSASSASSCLRRGSAEEADDQCVGVGHEGRAARQHELAGGDARARGAAGDVDLDGVGELRRVGLEPRRC